MPSTSWFSISIPHPQTRIVRSQFYQQVLERIRSLPGVERVGAVSRLPFSGGSSGRSFKVPGRDATPDADIRIASPDYFSTMGIPLLKGRNFTEHDRKCSLPVIVANEAMAVGCFSR